jgi:NADH-quinone oxidoreductase subunit G
MVVHTQNARVQAAQKAVHEFLLLNHPIDCPICDQAGECKLQNYYMKYQLQASRMRERKVEKPKIVPLGPYVTLNAERCIVCTRCVRFMEEIAQERQLAVIHRGDHAQISTFPGQQLDSAYSLNTVDICPVGALTSTPFRFKQRVWNLDRGPSLCPGCARGCNIHVDHRAGQAYRFLPRENDNINGAWLCDEGRLCTPRANHAPLDCAWTKQESMLLPSTPDDALQTALTLVQNKQEQPLLLLCSLDATVEDVHALLQLRHYQENIRIACLEYPNGESDRFLRVADKNPNRTGIDAVLAAHQQTWTPFDTLKNQHMSAAIWLGMGADDKTIHQWKSYLTDTPTVVLSPHESSILEIAHVVLPLCNWLERQGTWVNTDGIAQTLHPVMSPTSPRKSATAWLHDFIRGLGLEVTPYTPNAYNFAPITSSLSNTGTHA